MAFSFGGLVNGLSAGVGGALRGANAAEAERYKRKQEQDAITRQALQQALLDKRYDEEKQYGRQRDVQNRNDRIEEGVRADQRGWAQTILQGVQATDGLNAQGQREQGYENKLDPQGTYQPSVLRPAPKEFAPQVGGYGGDGPPKGARLVDDPTKGTKVWVHPNFPGQTWPAGVNSTVTPTVLADIRDNEHALKVVEDAIAGLTQHPEASGGLLQYAPQFVQSSVDPKGQKYRNPVSDVSSLKIHDRTGATAAAQELRRLGFIPDEREPVSAQLDKLTRFREEILQKTAGLREQYPSAQGLSEGGPQNRTSQTLDDLVRQFQSERGQR